MPERHELYAKFGVAAEVAQLFETELGTLLLMQRALSKGWHVVPDGEAARVRLEEIDRMTLGRMLRELEKHVEVAAEVKDIFSVGLDARNRLTHGFFEGHNYAIQTENGREKMGHALEDIHGKIFRAWRTASDITRLVGEHFLRIEMPQS